MNADAGNAARDQESAFAELLATELRRAPWFLLSIAVHAAIFALLLYFAGGEEGAPGRGLIVRAGTESAGEPGVESDPAPEPASPEPEAEAAPSFDEASDANPTAEREAMRQSLETSDVTLEPSWSSESLLTRIGGRRSKGGGEGQGAGDILAGSNGLPSGDGFRSTVAQIRKQGLEIVFVVDSTGSMGGVLSGAKNRIASMLDVLHALVPGTRIGVITYRDSGKDEDYLLRQVPLSRDYYRAASFVQTLVAKGGGDREEAVHEALLAALQLRWTAGAHRVVVLVGDAPPHPATESSVMNKLKAFTVDGRSHVHAILTSESGIAGIARDTAAAFEKLTRAGRGVCIPFDAEDTVLRQVLSLAFGHTYRRDIDQIYRLVEERRKQVATWALDAVRRKDLARIQKALATDPVEPEIVDAIVAMQDREVANYLVDLLGKTSIPESGRHAAAWALAQVLGLSRPILDPERGSALGARECAHLRDLVERRFR